MTKTKEERFNEFMKYVRNMDEVLEYVRDNYSPEDVFSATQLEKWAESERYIKEEQKD